MMVRRIIEAAMACRHSLDIPTTTILTAAVHGPLFLLGILLMPYLETHLGLGTNNNNNMHHSMVGIPLGALHMDLNNHNILMEGLGLILPLQG